MTVKSGKEHSVLSGPEVIFVAKNEPTRSEIKPAKMAQ